MTRIELFKARKVVQVKDDQADSVFQFMRDVTGPHELEIYEKGELEFAYFGNASPSANVSFGYLEYGTDVTVRLGLGIEHYTVALPLRGRQALSRAGMRFLSEHDKAIVLSPGLDFTVDIERDCRSLFITINRRLMELELRRLLGRSPSRSLVFETGMPTNTSHAASWWRAAEYYLREVLTEGSILSHPSVGAELELNLVRALLITHRNNYSDEISRNISEMVPEYLQRAKRYIEENYQENIRLDSIRRAAGVTSVKLCSGFKEFSGTTPMGYLKQIRLDKARELLMKGCSRKNVSSIALDVGFSHLGRFSIEYKNAFSESPTDTVARRPQ